MHEPEAMLTLRPFRQEDAELVASWLQAPGLARPPGKAGSEWAIRLLRDPNIVARTAIWRGHQVGFARLDIGRDRIAELTLLVAPAARRKRFGSRILNGIIEVGQRVLVRRLQAVVDRDNHVALKFFLANGFQEVAGDGQGLILQRLVHGRGQPLEIEL